MSFTSIIYGAYRLLAGAVTGGDLLPFSGLAYRNGSTPVEVDASTPLPVGDTTAHTKLDAIALALSALATQTTLAGVRTDLASILAKITANAATETTLAAVEGLLTSLLSATATAANQGTGNTALASIKTDLDTIAAGFATYAGQQTGNATLATISTDLAALASANHTDLGQLHTDLAAVLAKITASAATEATLSAAKSDLDTIASTVATAAKQDTGNTWLSSLDTRVSSLASANHTDLDALHTDLGQLHTDLGSILAKLPTTPATESTLSTASSYLATLAGAVSAARVAVSDATTQAYLAILSVSALLTGWTSSGSQAMSGGVHVAKVSAGVAAGATITNNTGSAVYMQWHSYAPGGTPSSSTLLYTPAQSIANGTSVSNNLVTGGIRLPAQVVLVLSSNSNPNLTTVASGGTATCTVLYA